MSDSSQSHGLKHTRPPCSSPSPEVCPSPCPLHQWLYPAISSSDALFLCPQSVPASGTFPKSWLFTAGDQNTGASASASVLPISIQGWFPLRLTGLISFRLTGLISDVILCNKFSGLKQYTFILLQFWRSEIQNQHASRAILFRGLRGAPFCCSFQPLNDNHNSLAYGSFLKSF